MDKLYLDMEVFAAGVASQRSVRRCRRRFCNRRPAWPWAPRRGGAGQLPTHARPTGRPTQHHGARSAAAAPDAGQWANRHLATRTIPRRSAIPCRPIRLPSAIPCQPIRRRCAIPCRLIRPRMAPCRGALLPDRSMARYRPGRPHAFGRSAPVRSAQDRTGGCARGRSHPGDPAWRAEQLGLRWEAEGVLEGSGHEVLWYPDGPMPSCASLRVPRAGWRSRLCAPDWSSQ